MKPTMKVSIGGISFNLEENAYRLLKQYLDRLQAHYEKYEGGKEIVDDIELRVSELIRERIHSHEQAVSESIVKEIIAILGQPEELEDNDGRPKDQNADTNQDAVRKKLYRDSEHRVLGGVCSGLAAYFKMDVVLVRIIFVLFFIFFSTLHFLTLGISSGTILLIYILLWIIVPSAQTVRQRYEMHGEKPNIKNIQRKVEEELREAGRSLEKSTSGAGEFFRIIGKICLFFAGALAIIIALSILLAFMIAFVTGYSIANGVLGDLLHYVDVDWNPAWFFGLLAALIFLPFIGLLYGGIKALFRIKTKVRIGLFIFLLWIVALFAFIGMSVFHAQSFFHWRTAHEYIELPLIHCDTLFVDIPEKYYVQGTFETVSDRMNHWSIHNKKTYKKSKRHKKYSHWDDWDEVDFHINNNAIFLYKETAKANEKLVLLPSTNSKRTTGREHFCIDVYKEAAGINTREAREHAKQISFNYTLKDSLLIIKPLLYSKSAPWDGELIRLHFQIPEGKTIVFGKAF